MVDEYIQVVGGLPKYRSRYHMFNNTCVHSVYFALSKLYPPEKLKALGDQNNLSSQALIRRVKKAFPGSKLMRASRTAQGWQLEEVDRFVPKGYRPYLWSGLALAVSSGILVPIVLSL